MDETTYLGTQNYTNLLKTMEYFRDSKPDLIYEQIIKTLAEPIISKAILDGNELLRLREPDENQKWFLFNRGGDALNYYYPINAYVPTNDWDLGLMNITDTQITDDLYQEISGWLKEWLEDLAKKLSRFFTQYVKQEYNNLLYYGLLDNGTIPEYFNYTNVNTFTRLHQIYFAYTNSSQAYSKNEMIDVMVYGNGIYDYADDIKGWENKFTYEQLAEYLGSQGPDLEPLEAYTQYFVDKVNNPESRFYPNTYKILVKDTVSGIYYMAPGDLLTDTLVMIWQSITNTNITINKLTKYLNKCAILIDAINKMIDICPDNTCEMISETILSRDTNYVVEDYFYDNPQPDEILDLFYNMPIENQEFIPQSKLRQMITYFKIYKMVKELLFPGKKLNPYIKMITANNMYTLTQIYILLNDCMIPMQSLQQYQMEQMLGYNDRSYTKILTTLGVIKVLNKYLLEDKEEIKKVVILYREVYKFYNGSYPTFELEQHKENNTELIKTLDLFIQTVDFNGELKKVIDQIKNGRFDLQVYFNEKNLTDMDLT